MLDNITLQYPAWFIIFCIALGLVYAGFMYWRETKFDDVASWVKPLMAALRFCTITLLSFLLLSPVIKSQKEDIQQPIVIIAEDKTQSIKTATSKEDLELYKQEMGALSSSVAEKYEVVNLSFGDDVTSDPVDSFKYNATNLSQTLKYIQESYSDQNIGAIILSSDGIYNEGKNPLYENLQFKAPLYTIALGDTTIKRDLSISNILHNKIAYLDDRSNVQVDINAKNAPGSSAKVKLYKYESGKRKLIAEKPISIGSSNDYKTLTFEVDNTIAGINKYTATITIISDEVTTANNARNFYVEVLDGKQKILLVADGPHPDLSALKSIITSNKNYEVETAFEGISSYKVTDYDLVLFHNLPSSTHDITATLKVIDVRKTPRLFIAGTQVAQAKFNNDQNVVKMSGNSTTNEVVQPEFKTAFGLFTISEELKARLKRYPPLQNRFAEYSSQSVSSSLLTQKIKKISTKYPLLSFSDQGGIKTGVLAGEGIWRWRIFDFQENQNYDQVTELVNKSIQYLTVKEDKRKFRVNLAQNVFKESDNLNFDGQLYNNSYQLINEPDVQIVINDADQKEYKYTFSKTNNYYTLNAGQFAEGNYQYKAYTNYGGETLISQGKFTVQRIELEQYNLTANHTILTALSDKFNGKTYYTNQIGLLQEDIVQNDKIKPVVYLSSNTESIMNKRFLFFGFLFLLVLEWFLRRYFGSY